MRTTLTVSAIAHALLWVLIALPGPEPFARQAADDPIVVDIVSPDEIGEAPHPQLPAETNAPEVATDQSPEPPPSPPPQRQEPPQRQDQAQQGRKAPRPEAASAPSAPAQAASAARAESKPAQPQPESPPQSQPWSSWIDTALSSPLVTASAGLGAVENAANLSGSDIAAFRAHLQQCWNPPAGLADGQRLVVVLRVSLNQNGGLTAEPTLLAASASPEGAALMQTAMRALHQCQPYGFLPAAKYREWKVLDLSFSPTGLSTLPTF